jgi:cellulose synthase/poly-beta-1,6-N-acetylglucosamine synthase-like glycosyltransferase
MKIIFWTFILAILYVYLGYPVLVYLLSIVFKKPIKKERIYPSVSIIISAYNEEENIENKIKSILSLDYPTDKLEVLIGSDGSTDNTEAIISRYQSGMIKLLRQERRSGKPSMLNLLANQAKGEILTFTDARQELGKNSLRELVDNFNDKKVGSVSSEMLFNNENKKGSSGIGLYWKYEKFIRSSESRIGSMLGATGAMYAIRKELFTELPKDLILDDVYIPLKIVQKGYRAIFEPEAKIYDKIAKSSKSEFLRKVRTLSGNFQVFIYLRELFNPFKSPIAFQLFSHKLLRLIVPFLLIVIFISNIFILDNTFYLTFMVLQCLFYALALIGILSKSANRLLNIPSMFCVMNLAAVVGLWKFATNKQSVMWQKSEPN